jgi:plasmid stability protein
MEVAMAQLVVRNIENDVKERLQRRAKKHGCSLEELVRDILRDAAKDTRPTGGLGSEIAALFKDVGFEEGEILEWRGYPVQPAKFDE